MRNQQIRYIHFRRPQIVLGRLGLRMQPSEFGGITIAYTKMAENEYKCAMARCNTRDKDRYNKTKGRDEAKTRLLENDDVWQLSVSPGADIYTEMLELVTQFKEFRRALRPEVRR